MLTKLPVADFAPSLLRAICRARWGAEIRLRAWKQANNPDKALNRESGEHPLMAIPPTAMINHLPGMRMARMIGGNGPIEDLGDERLHDALALHHQAAGRWEELPAFTPFMKRVARDKRKKIPGHAKGFWLRLERKGLFVRSHVVMERDAAKESPGHFAAGGTLSANRIEFVNLIADQLTAHGAMKPGLLYETPLTDMNPHGPDGIFNSGQAGELLERPPRIRARAVA